MLQHRAKESFDDMLAAAGGTMLGRFAAALRRDFAAINAALELPSTTCSIVGHIRCSSRR
jgi:hypothetical protein